MIKKTLRVVGSSWGQRIAILAIICIVMAISQKALGINQIFFNLVNVKNILLAISVNGIMVCGMLFTVLVGGMDLSVGSVAGISASIAFMIARSTGFSDGGFLYGCAVALTVCLVVGFLNGFFVTRFALPAFIVTLAMKNVVHGIIYFVTRGIFVLPPKHGLSFYIGNLVVFDIQLGGGGKLSIPMPVIMLIVVVTVCAFVLTKTTYGRKLYAIGGNKNVAKLVGIKTNANTIVAFMISSVLAGIAGIMLASMDGQAGQTTARSYEGYVLMAMVVGGINLAGGEGGVSGAVFGALFVGIINNVMNLLGVTGDIQAFVRGVIILGAMTLSVYAKRGSIGALRIKFKEQGKTDTHTDLEL